MLHGALIRSTPEVAVMSPAIRPKTQDCLKPIQTCCRIEIQGLMFLFFEMRALGGSYWRVQALSAGR